MEQNQTLTIGRDALTGRLKVNDGTRDHVYNDEAVPLDVSREHCRLTRLDDRSCMIVNLNADNQTLVNGQQVKSKTIVLGDTVQLGQSRYRLPLEKILLRQMPAGGGGTGDTIDLTPLEAVWQRYHGGLIAIRKRQQRINLMTRAPMIFTLTGAAVTGAMAATDYSTVGRHISLAVTIVAALLMLYGFYRQATDKSIDDQEELKKQFQKDYVCPNPECSRFMGFSDIDVIRHNGCCPYCKKKFKAKQPSAATPEG